MCPRNTPLCVVVTLGALATLSAMAQVPRPDWRRIGNAAFDLSLGSTAGGPVERVWYSPDGARLYARVSADRTFVTGDFETWTPAPADIVPPAVPDDSAASTRPEPGARIRGQILAGSHLYAVGRFIYRSEDRGTSWISLTNFKGASILGDGMRDLAVSPKDASEITVASSTGVWRSLDGGESWIGLNDGLPNLPVRRILATPQNGRGTRVALEAAGSLIAYEWQPGEKQAWRSILDPEFAHTLEMRTALSATLGAKITAVAVSGDYQYAGSADGRLWASTDRGRTWNPSPDQYAAPVESIYVDGRDPRMALAVLGARAPAAAPTVHTAHVLRSVNGGGFWDDLTANLPDVAAHGITAERASGAVYVATERGVYLAYEDLAAAGPAASWTALADSVAGARATDVRLDPYGHQLYAALDGYGIYAAPAPHRFRAPRVASAADFADRAAAPGALLTIFGANVRSARAGETATPVLSSTDARSEIQVPFDAQGTSLSLAVESAGRSLTFGIPLQTAAPAIFVDAEGAPMALDADSGLLLDPMHPARSNARMQILATGLGKVVPEWRSGVPAPVDNPPAVVAPVRVFLDREPVEVTRATLAPYVGFYLVEIQVPKLVNYGPAELYMEVDGQPSNRVRVYIEP